MSYFYEAIYGLISLITVRDESDDSSSELQAFFQIKDPGISEEKFNEYLIKNSKIKDEKIYQNSRELLVDEEAERRQYACAIIWATAAVNGLTPDEVYWIDRVCKDLRVSRTDLESMLNSNNKDPTKINSI
jgi:hypothetical protein